MSKKQTKMEWVAEHPVLTGIFAFTMFLFLLIVCFGGDSVDSTTTSDKLNVGELGILIEANGLLIPVGTTNDALLNWIDASYSNDEYGKSQLLYFGQIMPIKSGTKVLKLGQASMGVDKIRILEGSYANTIGYTVYERLVRA